MKNFINWLNIQGKAVIIFFWLLYSAIIIGGARLIDVLCKLNEHGATILIIVTAVVYVALLVPFFAANDKNGG